MSQILAALDPVAAARMVIANPGKRHTVSIQQIDAICRALVDAHDNPTPAISDNLALAARALIAVHDGFPERAKTLGDAHALAVTDASFKSFKTLFEEEFPNV